MNRVVEHGDGEEEGDGQGLSQTKPSPVEPDHEKKLNLRLSKQLLTTAPARAGSHHPLRRAKRVHHPICNIYPSITFHFLWKTLLENREHFHTIKCAQRGVKRYNTKNTQMMRA